MQYKNRTDNTVINSDQDLQRLHSDISLGFPLPGDILDLLNYDAFPEPPITYSADLQIAALWKAANDFQTNYFSGVAVGLLTIGVLQNLPTSLAIMGWINSVWSLYYQRKAAITDNALTMPDLDFTSLGDMPFTVPDMVAEVQGAQAKGAALDATAAEAQVQAVDGAADIKPTPITPADPGVTDAAAPVAP